MLCFLIYRDAVDALLKYEASTNIPDFAGVCFIGFLKVTYKIMDVEQAMFWRHMACLGMPRDILVNILKCTLLT